MKSICHLRLTKTVSMLLLIALLSGAVACRRNTPSQKDVETITLADALSEQVTVPKNPQRVAALLGSFADVWMLAGGDLCAAAEDAWEDFNLPLSEDTVHLGGAHSPVLESLLSATPDLVLASASTASHVKMKDTLESMGIAVLYFNVDNFNDYLHMLEICTTLTQRPDLYQQNGLALQSQIDQIKAQYAGKSIPESERTVLLLRASASSVKAKGSVGTILGEMLRDMGCINIADSNSTLLENLSIEAILEKDPHRIFAVTMGSDTQGATQALLRLLHESPAWASLSATKAGRVHVMDKTLFNLKPNARWAQAYQTLYETLTTP